MKLREKIAVKLSWCHGWVDKKAKPFFSQQLTF